MRNVMIVLGMMLVFVLLHSEVGRTNKSRFNVSGGYTSGWISKFDNPFSSYGVELNYDFKSSNGLNASFSWLYLYNKHLAIEPGVKFLKRGEILTVTGLSNAENNIDKLNASLSYLDLFCKLKFNQLNSYINFPAIEIFPYVGYSNAFLVRAREQIEANRYDIETGEYEIINEEINPQKGQFKQYNDIEPLFMGGLDFVFANRYALGIDYNRSFEKLPNHMSNRYVQSLNVSVGVLF